MNSHSQQVQQILTEGGWYYGRDAKDALSLPQDYEAFPWALQVLREFGGLRVGRSGPGIESATSSICFSPSLAEGTMDELGQLHCHPIYPLGEIDDGHALLFLDQQGHVFILTDKLELVGTTFHTALEVLLLGLTPR